ncbi:hypothetical protein [Lutispora sp.]|uniref:hypothetical protein n=1 Tax=Lutispora sp. TaxID=2828727 RepID=UPI002B204FA7|nr:hypothetical protein [Lutispora sp.]MEA4962468.1 hypothetical protein [Lutispora sp.]
MVLWAKTMEDGKNLDSTIEESLGVEEATCIESVVRNWRDPTLHSESCREAAYKPKGEVASLQRGSRRRS